LLPANSTTLREADGSTPGAVFKVAGGAALALSDCVPGCGTPVNINQSTITTLAAEPGTSTHDLEASPVNGTIAEGLPSASYWRFSSGKRCTTTANPAAVMVDDSSLQPYPTC
jgi:hypothetical protein